MAWFLRIRCSLRGRSAGLALGAAVLTVMVLACPGRCRADAVSDLRDALAVAPGPLGPSPRFLEYRRQELTTRIKALRTINELYRALLLSGWRDDPKTRILLDINPKRNANEIKLWDLDRDMHTRVKDRLVAALRFGMEQPTTRLAVATFIGEMGSAVRTSATVEPFGLTRSLAPELARLTRDPQAAVRLAAARALGKINPEPQEALPALQRLLAEKDVGPRRAAAEALPELVATVVDVQRKTQKEPGTLSEDVLKTTEEVAKVAARAAADADAVVRRAALNAIKLSAAVLENQIPADPADFLKVRLGLDPFPKYLFAQPTPQDSDLAKEIQAAAAKLRRELAVYRPLTLVLAELGPTLASRVQGQDARARLYSLEAFENMASDRRRLRRLQQSIPPLDPPLKDASLTDDPLLPALLAGRKVIETGLADSDPQIRLRAVEFLEELDEEARPTLHLLTRALGDPDTFVRWAAARTMAHVAPAEPGVAVPALARALGDPDPDARTAVAYALERYRQAAGEAVPALTRATQLGDAEARVAAIQALPLVVNGGAAEAVEALAGILKDKDVRIRRAAAEALGNIRSPAVQGAIPALRAALNDPDDEVRRLASESLLTIQLEAVPPSPRGKGL
jgi:HEAT repeat protein